MNKESFIYFLSGIFISFALNLIFLTFFYQGNKKTDVYVVDLKGIVDKLYSENLKKSSEDPVNSKKYEQEFDLNLKKLSETLNSYEVPVFVKGAVVNIKNGHVIDITNTVYKEIKLEKGM